MKQFALLMMLGLCACTGNQKSGNAQDGNATDSVRIEAATPAGTENLQEDSLVTLSGMVRLGHEVRSFQPENSDKEFWIVDKSGQLEEKYNKLTGGNKNGKPVKATLKLKYDGQWEDGFAAEYDGVYLVSKVIQLEKP